MSDYSSTWTEQDGVDDIDSSDFSTEFDAIATAIATKGDTELANTWTADQTLSGADLICGAGDGIDFSATADGSGSTTSELLDDYEEGTWTPVLTDGTNNASSSGGVRGDYTKIGNLVHYSLNLATNSLGSVSGSIYIEGLPFTSSSTAGTENPISSAKASGLNIATTSYWGHSISGYVEVNTTRIKLEIWDAITGTSAMQSSEWTADGACIISGTYRV